MRTHDVAELAQTLFEEIGDAAFIADPRTMRVLDVNPMAQRLTGLARADLMRLPLDRLFRSDDDGGLAHLQRTTSATAAAATGPRSTSPSPGSTRTASRWG